MSLGQYIGVAIIGAILLAVFMVSGRTWVERLLVFGACIGICALVMASAALAVSGCVLGWCP